jgi:cell wall-associated NlpC family hydrolase
MSTTLLGSYVPGRLASMLIAALFGLALAINPTHAPNADAAVSASVGARAVNVAKAQVGIRYTNGGTSPRTGFDCSGLTQYAYARAGKHIPRTAQQQYAAAIRIHRKYARPGDLVFFYSNGVVTHVGIFAGHWSIYASPHAGARVKLQKIYTSKVLFGRVR